MGSLTVVFTCIRKRRPQRNVHMPYIFEGPFRVFANERPPHLVPCWGRNTKGGLQEHTRCCDGSYIYECAWPPLSTHSLLTFPPAEWPLLDFSRPANNRTRLQTGLSPLHNAVLLDLGSSAQKLAFRGANVNGVDKVCNICFSCNLCLRPTVYPVESSEEGTSPAKLMGVQIVYAVDTYVCPSKFEIFSDTVRANAPFILERSQQYIVSWTRLPFTYLASRINGIH